MTVMYTELQETHLDAAAQFVCARVAALRAQQTQTIVPNHCVAQVRAQLAQLIQDVPCIAALADGRLTGFLGAFLTNFRGIPTAYVPDWGHAARGDVYHLYRGMVRALAGRWLENGCFQHAVTFFAHERAAMEAWTSLGFGTVVIDAVRAPGATHAPPDGLDIRRATPDDLEAVLRLELELRRHLARPPVFLPLLLEPCRAEWSGRLAQADGPVWVAWQDAVPVAFFSMRPPEHALLPLAAPDTIAIDGAFTQPFTRGRGVAGALLNTGLAWAERQGYARVAVDFETANIEASHFWLGHGFQSVCHSYMRRVDTRLAWANAGRNPVDIARAYGWNLTTR